MPRPAENSPNPGLSRDQALHAQGGGSRLARQSPRCSNGVKRPHCQRLKARFVPAA